MHLQDKTGVLASVVKHQIVSFVAMASAALPTEHGVIRV